MRPTTIRSLGDILRDLLSDIGDPEPSLYDLQATGETEAVERDLQAAREEHARLVGMGAGSVSIKRAEVLVSSLEQSLVYALRRDDIRADRPPGCWCLGAGGRGPRYVPLPTGETYTLGSSNGEGAHDGEERAAVYDCELLQEYCGCRDGAERKRRDDRNWRLYRSHRTGLLIRRLFGESRIPKEYRRFPWRSLPKPNAVRQAAEWLSDPGDHPWLLLWGKPGRGKTTIAGGIAAELVERGEAVLFRTMPDILQEIRATYNPANPNDETELITLLKSVPWLFLDDIGAEAPTGWEGERLYQILNHRHNEHLSTVLTSNLGPEKLSEHLGDRLFGRVKRMALYVFVGGIDLRDLAHGEPVPANLE